MVRMIDQLSSKKAPKGKIHQHKKMIMSRVANHLRVKFGTIHTPKQVNKRFSDLKVRECLRLGAIRRKIMEAKDAQEQRRQNLMTDEQNSTSVGETHTSVGVCNQTMLVVDNETFALHVQPIIDPPSPPQEPQLANPTMNRINLCMDHSLAKMQAELYTKMLVLFQNLDAKINTKFAELLTKIQSLEEKLHS